MDAFDIIQAKYRSSPWNESGKRFGIITCDEETDHELELGYLLEEDKMFQENWNNGLKQTLSFD